MLEEWNPLFVHGDSQFSLQFRSMNRENRPLITYEPVEAQDFRKTTGHLWGMYGIYLKSVKTNRKITPCNRLGLENTRISADYAQKPPQTMVPILMWERATPHTRLRARDHCTSITLIGGKRSWSKFASHYAWGTNGVCECKMDVESTWIPAWHRMDHVSCSLGL